MIALSAIVLGAFALQRLGVDLLPHIIYPDIRVRVSDPGVPATIMEDRVTRPLEEQLAVTEDAIGIQSRTSEGQSSVDLSFGYGKDIDLALRDASARLDRAKRFLPDTIDAPIIYKRDPSQIPIAEFVVSSSLRDPVELRSWVDYIFSKWFLNLPGVAATEVGGGLIRQIQVLPDQQRLAGVGLDILDLEDALEQGNLEEPGGRLRMSRQEIGGRTAGRFRSVAEIAELPIHADSAASGGDILHLNEIAQVIDSHEDERLRIRLNDVPGIKLAIQKQPQANTVAVVDTVNERVAWLEREGLIPEDVRISPVTDQAVFVRRALTNAAVAALSGALLAMLVVYLFLGNLRRTLIIGSAIPIAIMVTFALMALGGLTLNIMTLGGLALGVGMLVDNTIVMLENIVRHQRAGETGLVAPVRAAAEVNSAIVAATSTNLAAVLPFLFIGGLIGLLFRELIFTISAAIVASLVVALTLVPALAARISQDTTSRARTLIDSLFAVLQRAYVGALSRLLPFPWLVLAAFVVGLAFTVPDVFSARQTFLPDVDEGQISISLVTDPGINLDEMDRTVTAIEALIREQPDVDTWFSTVGGFVFGRSEFEAPNRSDTIVRLLPQAQRSGNAAEWIERMEKQVAGLQLAGVKIQIRNRGVRGIRLGSGDDDVSLRIRGTDLDTLTQIAEAVVERLQHVQGLSNVLHSAEEIRQEIAVQVDRERASSLGFTVEDIGKALRIALEGIQVTDFIDGDRSFDVYLRLPQSDMTTPEDLESILLFADDRTDMPIHLGDVAAVQLASTPANIQRDQQQRVVEVSASLSPPAVLGEVSHAIESALSDLELPEGYTLYDGGAVKTLQEGRQLSQILLALALFLVFVVMAVQYESLRNPLVILLSVPFTSIGVALGLQWLQLPTSMPVWLGLIMLAGIVVNNAIILVEYIEIERRGGREIRAAIVEAARLRLRPILMTTLTTVVGMLPLAIALGEGAELLQPLAITMVFGLSFSALVSLVLVPLMYRLLAGRLPA